MQEHRRRRKTAGAGGIELPELPEDRRGSDGVDIAIRTAAERGKADTEHRPDVPVARLTHNRLLQAADRLIDHRKHTTSLDALGRHLHAPSAGRRKTIYRGVHPSLSAVRIIEVEPLPAFSAEPTG